MRSTRPQTVFRSVILVLFLAACVLGFVVLPLPTIAYDLPINYAAAWDLRQGGPLYDPQRLEQAAQALGLERGPLPYTTLFASYLQPPLAALLHIPFTFLPYAVAKVAFLALNLALLDLTLRLATGVAAWRARVQPPALGLALITLLLGFRELVMTLHLGQTNIWVLACLAGSLWALERRRWWLVGLLVATATGLKLLPGVAILWLLARGQVRAALWSVGFIGVFFLGTLVALGPETYLRYYENVLLPTSNGSAHFLNASLLGFAMRFVLPPAEWLSPNAAPALDWAPLARVALLLWALSIILLLRRNPWTYDRSASSLELGAVLAGVMVASPIAWEHYSVWLLFAVPAGVKQWSALLPGRRGIWVGIAVWELFNIPTEWLVSFGAPMLLGFHTSGLLLASVMLRVGRDSSPSAEVSKDGRNV